MSSSPAAPPSLGRPPTVGPLPAELLLLMLTASGPLVRTAKLQSTLVGALLSEFILRRTLIHVEADDGPVRSGRLTRTGWNEPHNPALVDALTVCHARVPTRAFHRVDTAVLSRGRAVRRYWCGQAIAAGHVTAHRRKRLGLFEFDTWRLTDAAPRAELVAQVQAALVTDPNREFDERTAALVSLAWAAGVMPRLLPDYDGMEIFQRGQYFCEAQWGGAAIHDIALSVLWSGEKAVELPAVQGGHPPPGPIWSKPGRWQWPGGRPKPPVDPDDGPENPAPR